MLEFGNDSRNEERIRSLEERNDIYQFTTIVVQDLLQQTKVNKRLTTIIESLNNNTNTPQLIHLKIVKLQRIKTWRGI